LELNTATVNSYFEFLVHDYRTDFVTYIPITSIKKKQVAIEFLSNDAIYVTVPPNHWELD
jgi:hypothetical protein